MSLKLICRVDVDTQYGFCDPEGGLYVKGSESVISEVARLNREALVGGGLLIGSVDTHEPKDKEFKEQGGIWPVHCVKGTRDWLKHPDTLPGDFRFVSMQEQYSPVHSMQLLSETVGLFFEKNVYSLFDNKVATEIVQHLIAEGYSFEVYGIATDYCVKAAALGIKKLASDAKVKLLLNACAGVAPDTTEAAIKEMEQAGVIIVR